MKTSPSSKQQHASMGSNHLPTPLAGLHQAARSWHCHGGTAPLRRAGLGWGFFITFLLLKKQQTFPARFAAGISPATWLEQRQEHILLQDLIVIRNVNRHQEKPLRSGSSRCRELLRQSCLQRGKGRAVHPTELFVITALKMLRCTDRDCRHSPYLSCKALLIWQPCGWFFLSPCPPPFPSKRNLDQQPQFTRHFTPLPVCIWEEQASFGLGARAYLGATSLTPRAPELSTHPSSGEACTKVGRAAFVDLCLPPGPLPPCFSFFFFFFLRKLRNECFATQRIRGAQSFAAGKSQSHWYSGPSLPLRSGMAFAPHC